MSLTHKKEKHTRQRRNAWDVQVPTVTRAVHCTVHVKRHLVRSHAWDL